MHSHEQCPSQTGALERTLPDKRPLTRREWLVTAACCMMAFVKLPSRFTTASIECARLSVYKNSECTCCQPWISYLRTFGIDVASVHNLEAPELQTLKNARDVPAHLRSCHTGILDVGFESKLSYVIEGHVPAEAILELVRSRAAVRGLAVPGMLVGTPGMEVSPSSTPSTLYSVTAFSHDGEEWIFGWYERRKRSE